MIERLNFYDLYGYLLPGLTLIALLWLPYRVVSSEAPMPTAVSSVLLSVLLAYIIGHPLQALARLAFPARDRGRSFGDSLLDVSDKTLSKQLKVQLYEKIRTRFDIEVSDDGDQNPAVRETRRTDALLLCRAALVQNKAGAYAEQAEGMYSLMRGVAAACILGAAYHLGWFISAYLPKETKESKDAVLGVLLIFSVTAALVFVVSYAVVKSLRQHFKKHGIDDDSLTLFPMELRILLYLLPMEPHLVKEVVEAAFKVQAKAKFLGVALLMGYLGYWLGVDQVTSTNTSHRLLAVSLVAFFLFVTCMDAYYFFAKGFATIVYRDFVSLIEKPNRKRMTADKPSRSDGADPI